MSSQTKRRKRPDRTTVQSAAKTVDAEVSSGLTTASVSASVGLLENRTLGWSLLAAVLVWAAFPPLGLWPLAWIAPYGWLRLIRTPQLDGKRPFWMIYLIGYLHWLMMTQWVSLPHPSAAVGWLFLAAYLAIYVVGFVALARWLVHRARWPSVIAAPVSWVSMEVLRSYLFTGFALAPLSHTQVSFLPVIQVADFTGAYGVSFLVVLVAAAIERMVHGARRDWWPVGLATCVLGAVLCYGWFAARQTVEPEGEATVAIIQGTLDTEFGPDQRKRDRAFKQYSRMSREVTARNNIDLVVWPESMFRFDIVSYDESMKNGRLGPESYTFGEWSELSDTATKKLVREIGTTCLVGTSTEIVREDVWEHYNTAALFEADGQQIGEYHKVHPVMFGEYIPLGNIFPWLYDFTPMQSGLSPGAGPKSFTVGDVSFTPNICFENTVPHLIRRQVRDLEDAGQRVDALVTLTNDGWFWGSALLDLHLACGIFRAIENRKPMLIAANTGFSAHIDQTGRVLQKGPRRASQVLVARVGASQTPASFYTRFGDCFAGGCVGVCLVGIAIGMRKKF